MSTNRNIHDVIVERIHSSFAELIPEVEMRDLVTSAIDRFKTPKTRTEYNRTVDVPSPLQEIVNKAVSELVEKSVTEAINNILKPSFAENGERIASAIVTEIVRENITELMTSFVTGVAVMNGHQMIERFRSDLRSRGLNI